jgi:hypothetical protein
MTLGWPSWSATLTWVLEDSSQVSQGGWFKIPRFGVSSTFHPTVSITYPTAGTFSSSRAATLQGD